MSHTRKWLQRSLIILIASIGVYMLSQFVLPSPPAISGVAFLLIAAALWVPHCPLLGALLQDTDRT